MLSSNKSAQTQAKLKLLFGLIIIGSFPIFFNELAIRIPPILGSFLLFSIVAVLNMLISLLRQTSKNIFKLDKKDWGILLLIAIVSYLGNSFVLKALSYGVDPAVVQSIARIEAIFIALGGVIIFKEILNLKLASVLFFILLGIAVMGVGTSDIESSQLEITPLILVIFSALFFATFQILSKFIVHRVDVFTLNATRSMICLVLGLPFVYQYFYLVDFEVLFYATISAFVGPFLGRNIILSSAKHLPLNYIGCSVAITPVITLFLQWLVFNSLPSNKELIGGAIIMFAVLLYSLKAPNKKNKIIPLD